jgi:hypothetical protein
MRTRLFFFTILLTAPLIIFSQNKTGTTKLKQSEPYWGIGYYVSGNVNAYNDYEKSKGEQIGWGGTIEITNYFGQFELMLIASRNRFEIGDFHYETNEFTLGPRFKFDKNGSYFAEFTAGCVGYKNIHNIYITVDPEFYLKPDETEYEFGFSAGFGIKFPLNKNTGLIFKSRLVTSLPLNNKNMVSYISASTGVVLNSAGDKRNKNGNKKSYFGLTALAGLNNPNTFKNDDYQWSPSYGGEMNYRLYPQLELIVMAIYNPMKFNNNENISNHKMLSAVGGGRIFINENPYTAFIEFMGGLYEYTFRSKGNVTGEIYEAAEDNFGLCLGTGAKLKVYKLIDFIIKSDLNFIFSGEYQDSPNYLTVHGGLRFNL